MGASSRAASVGQELVLYAVSAALSCLVLFVGLRHLDPNRSQAKKAAERKKEISRRLGRPYIQTNTYEVGKILPPWQQTIVIPPREAACMLDLSAWPCLSLPPFAQILCTSLDPISAAV